MDVKAYIAAIIESTRANIAVTMNALLRKDEVEQIVRQCNVKDDIEIAGFSVEPFEGEVTGFLSQYNRLRVNVKVNGCFTKEVTYFMKSTPDGNPQMYDYSVSSGAFAKEVSFYSTLIKGLERIGKNDGRNQWCPKPLYTKSDLIVLEDLTSQNYKMAPSDKTLDLNHVKISLKTAATMHAQCLVLEQTAQKEISVLYPEVVKEINYSTDKSSPFRQWMLQALKQYSVFADFLDGYSEDERQVLREKCPLILEDLYELTRPSKQFKNIYNQGDLWGNNLLFKYNEENNPIHAIIVDYQLSRYLPPAHDVAEIIFFTTTKALREAEEENLLKFYHQELKLELQRYDHDVDKIIPWKEFRTSWDYYRKLGLLRAALILNIVITPKSIKEEVFATTEGYSKFILHQRADYIKKGFQICETYKVRNLDIWKEVADKYILNKKPL